MTKLTDRRFVMQLRETSDEAPEAYFAASQSSSWMNGGSSLILLKPSHHFMVSYEFDALTAITLPRFEKRQRTRTWEKVFRLAAVSDWGVLLVSEAGQPKLYTQCTTQVRCTVLPDQPNRPAPAGSVPI